MSLGALPGNIVQFRLTSEGIEALSGLFEGSAFEAQVTEVDQFGIWVHLQDQLVMLLKWPYIAAVTALYEGPIEDRPVRSRIGF